MGMAITTGGRAGCITGTMGSLGPGGIIIEPKTGATGGPARARPCAGVCSLNGPDGAPPLLHCCLAERTPPGYSLGTPIAPRGTEMGKAELGEGPS